MTVAPRETVPWAARRSAAALVALALLALVWAVYGQVGGHAFVDWDDGEYVYENAKVLAGLGADGISWAFTTRHAANWHPLTWISHMADVELFGLDAGWHHLVSVLLHAVNAVLLFLVLRAATGATWRSAFAAALFAVHPLHVESVAWVAERKDVLSTAFGLLAVGAYVRHARRPGARRLVPVAAALALGLLAKPMLVTLPFALLLLDAWPLGRLERGALRRLVAEKLPLFVIAAASCAVTYAAQASKAATATLEGFPLGARLANAAVAYVAYLAKTLWPGGLAMFYPHPASLGDPIPASHVAGALALLAAATALAVLQARRRPYLLVGWLWYLGTLLPVIGLVQVGAQAMADRYTYLPHVGLLVAAVWGVHDLAGAARRARLAAAVGGAAVVAALAAAAFLQAGHWRDAPSLYGHAIAVTRRNFVAWNNLGIFHLGRGDVSRAAECFGEAIRAKPDHAISHYNLGVAYAQAGHGPAAMAAYREAVILEPEYADAWVNLGLLLRATGELDAAISCHARALRIRPGDPYALEDLAIAHAQRGDPASAAAALRSLAGVNPPRAAELARVLVLPTGR